MTNKNHQNREEAKELRSNKGGSYMIPAAILVAGVLIAGAFFYSAGSSNPAEPSQPSQSSGSAVSVDIENEPFIGDPNAPVTMVWFSDMNCMFCRRFAQETFPKIVKDYVQNGKVKVVKKAFITMGEDSYVLHRASQAVWEMVGKEKPELYWRWAKAISDDQPTRKKNSKPVMEDIISTTQKVDGMDAEELVEKIGTISREEIQNDIEQGRQRGISGTPGFVIYKTGSDTGTTVSGAQPYTVFQQTLDQLLES